MLGGALGCVRVWRPLGWAVQQRRSRLLTRHWSERGGVKILPGNISIALLLISLIYSDGHERKIRASVPEASCSAGKAAP